MPKEISTLSSTTAKPPPTGRHKETIETDCQSSRRPTKKVRKSMSERPKRTTATTKASRKNEKPHAGIRKGENSGERGKQAKKRVEDGQHSEWENKINCREKDKDNKPAHVGPPSIY